MFGYWALYQGVGDKEDSMGMEILSYRSVNSHSAITAKVQVGRVQKRQRRECLLPFLITQKMLLTPQYSLQVHIENVRPGSNVCS